MILSEISPDLKHNGNIIRFFARQWRIYRGGGGWGLAGELPFCQQLTFYIYIYI